MPKGKVVPYKDFAGVKRKSGGADGSYYDLPPHSNVEKTLPVTMWVPKKDFFGNLTGQSEAVRRNVPNPDYNPQALTQAEQAAYNKSNTEYEQKKKQWDMDNKGSMTNPTVPGPGKADDGSAFHRPNPPMTNPTRGPTEARKPRTTTAPPEEIPPIPSDMVSVWNDSDASGYTEMVLDTPPDVADEDEWIEDQLLFHIKDRDLRRMIDRGVVDEVWWKPRYFGPFTPPFSSWTHRDVGMNWWDIAARRHDIAYQDVVEKIGILFTRDQNYDFKWLSGYQKAAEADMDKADRILWRRATKVRNARRNLGAWDNQDHAMYEVLNIAQSAGLMRAYNRWCIRKAVADGKKKQMSVVRPVQNTPETMVSPPADYQTPYGPRPHRNPRGRGRHRRRMRISNHPIRELNDPRPRLYTGSSIITSGNRAHSKIRKRPRRLSRRLRNYEDSDSE